MHGAQSVWLAEIRCTLKNTQSEAVGARCRGRLEALIEEECCHMECVFFNKKCKAAYDSGVISKKRLNDSTF